ncbi:MAG: hypothetical protein OFPII_15170 [Osedax symbiont Rs1]|nr:MAG: hypothetical protein OFPII_15170 [Osedax symbiont Rs1]
MNLSAYSEPYQLLSNREKVLILLSSMGLIIALPFLLVIEPQFKAAQKTQRVLEQSRSQNATYQQQTAVLAENLNRDPKISLNLQITDLQAEKAQLASALNEQRLSVISAADFSDFMAVMLTTNPALQITDVQIEAIAYAGEELDADTDSSAVLKHNIRLSLQASNTEIKAYLKFLESQPIALSWDSIEYNRIGKEQTQMLISFHLFAAKE